MLKKYANDKISYTKYSTSTIVSLKIDTSLQFIVFSSSGIDIIIITIIKL